MILRLLLALAAGLGLANQATAGGNFRVRPSEVGAGEKPGEVRRIIQPFGEWTLVCDEDLRRRRKVCNVSQSFMDGAGETAFSWSLAATESGAPALILRMSREGRDARFATLRFTGEPDPVEVTLATCAGEVCLGFLPVGPKLAARLRAGGRAAIEILHDGRFETIDAPLAGLATALSTVR